MIKLHAYKTMNLVPKTKKKCIFLLTNKKIKIQLGKHTTKNIKLIKLKKPKTNKNKEKNSIEKWLKKGRNELNYIFRYVDNVSEKEFFVFRKRIIHCRAWCLIVCVHFFSDMQWISFQFFQKHNNIQRFKQFCYLYHKKDPQCGL